MADKTGEPTGSGNPEKTPIADGIPLHPSGDVVTQYGQTAPRAPDGKQVTPRRPLPLVPEARPEKNANRQVTDGSDPGNATP